MRGVLRREGVMKEKRGMRAKEERKRGLKKKKDGHVMNLHNVLKLSVLSNRYHKGVLGDWFSGCTREKLYVRFKHKSFVITYAYMKYRVLELSLLYV